MLGVAIARPQATVALPRPEGTVMLTFDVSASMAATDLPPTRMEAAQTIASNIVKQQPPGVVIGIVAFSDAGIAVQAPTSDQADVLAAIDRLTPSNGTSVGQGLIATLGAIQKAEGRHARRLLQQPLARPDVRAGGRSRRASDASTVIVLLSDGENNERPDPIQVAQQAADLGHPDRHDRRRRARTAPTSSLDGFKVHTQLDDATLQQIADIPPAPTTPPTTRTGSTRSTATCSRSSSCAASRSR